jgi:hypothetical protein
LEVKDAAVDHGLLSVSNMDDRNSSREGEDDRGTEKGDHESEISSPLCGGRRPHVRGHWISSPENFDAAIVSLFRICFSLKISELLNGSQTEI